MPDVVLGIDFGGSKTALAIAEPGGTILARAVLEVEPHQEASVTLGAAIGAGRQLLADVGGRCRAVGVATPGIPTEAGVELSPNLAGWEGLMLGREIGAGFDVKEVRVENDVKCAAGAELRWGALRGADPALYVNLGTGIAAAVAFAGRVVDGAHGGAGEIGYARFWAPEHASKAMLEELAGGRSLAERAAKLTGAATSTEELFAAPAGSGLGALIETALQALVAQLRNAVLLLDPERIALGGGLMAQRQRILETLRDLLEVPAPLGPEIVAAVFSHDAPLRGALALVLDGVAVEGALKKTAP